MISTFRKLSALLDQRERRRAVVVFVLMVGTAFLEALGVASIMPFVAVLMNPEIIDNNAYVRSVYDLLGFTDRNSFMVLFGSVLLFVFVSSLAFRALTTYAILRFSTMRLHTLACRLLSAYLRQPYEFFLGRNTATMAKSVLAEVSQVSNGVLVPAMQLMSAVLVSVALIGLLLIVSPVVSLAVAAGLALAYGGLYLLMRRLVARIGVGRLDANRRRFILTSEVLGGVKELRVLGRETDYLDRFRKPSLLYAQYQASSKVIQQLPRYGIEAVAFGGMLGALLYMVQLESGAAGLQDSMPLIALYGFAVYRLLPTFQLIFASANQMRFNMPAVDTLVADLTQKEQNEQRVLEPQAPALGLRRELRLEGISYRYPGADRPSLDRVDLTIAAGSSVGFVGRTGAGKTTIVDIILGLLSPQEGRLLIDGQAVTSANVRAWQRSLAYVPQSIFLADDTVAANIAFGLRTQAIDQDKVEEAARIAQIHDFVVGELPLGYQTIVGERGTRLSGGQRQRLAIARALYHNPDVLIFDEATSALDNATEAALMEAIEQLRGNKTIIQVAHRLNTVRACDTIVLMERGRIVEQGPFDGLMAGSDDFRRLAAVG